MAIPFRGHTGQWTYFVTASTYLKQHLLQSQPTALLFIDVLYHYRRQGKFQLHEFVVMPDHFHLLITPGPQVTLERNAVHQRRVLISGEEGIGLGRREMAKQLLRPPGA